jgi:hypothetical protein
MAEQPLWKGKFVDREWLKGLLRDGFRRCAKQDVETVLGALVNDIEEYVAGEVLLNTGEALDTVIGELQRAKGFWKEFADGIAEHQVSRRAAQMERGGPQS